MPESGKPSLRVDKQQARKAFSRAASTYDQAAVLQREIGERMLERLDYVKLQPQVILDAGAGTGVCSHELLMRYKKARIVSMDFALPMLGHAKKQGRWLRRPSCLCGDIEHIPLADESVDLLFSNAAIQWCADLPGTFAEFMRVLKPNGLLMFSTFGPDTLRELRAAWAQVDEKPHTSGFFDMHDIGDMLLQAQFADPVMDAERLTLTYAEVDGLLRDLKMLGANNATQQRSRGMTGKQRWQQMRDAYETFRHDGRLPATYEVVYGHAWRPQQLRQQVQQNGEVFVPLDRIGRSS
ncbi:MAG: malonyl-ACP O-methyltransferase BioC [Chromatiales bacterium]|jgi:malonyl-CoA O-methyltransferase